MIVGNTFKNTIRRLIIYGNTKSDKRTIIVTVFSLVSHLKKNISTHDDLY